MSEDQVIENMRVIVAEKLNTIPNFNEDVKYVAEYIVLLMSNGGSIESIVQELTSLFDNVPADALTDVVQTAFFALEAVQQGETVENIVNKIRSVAGNAQVSPAQEVPAMEQQQVLEQQQQIPQQLEQQQQKQLPSQHMLQSQHLPTQQEQEMSNANGGPVSAFANIIPTGPSAMTSTDTEMDIVSTGFQPRFNQRDNGIAKRGARGGRGGRGASRGATRGGRNSNLARFNPLAKALGMDSDGSVNVVHHKKEGRCKLFPRCPLGRSCPHAHPTKVCNEYPNCPKPAGTCEYLHPNEDEELMREMEKTREEFQKRKEAMIAARTKPVQTGIVLCKFGVICSNPMCPFGHPTPANEDAKVIDLMWCANNLKCQDPQCTKAHSSLSKIKSIAPMGSNAMAAPIAATRAPVEKSLDQCKFGTKCTNKHCKYRHARSHVMCREGADCTRLDCFFGHPINENCRFAVECKNPKCLFKHPEGRVLTEKPASSFNTSAPSFTPGASNSFNTSERPFALPEGSEIRPAPTQEGLVSMHATNDQDTDMN